ncbi:MAG: uracil phosphoribosyltransferase [Clostridiales bacterium]
MKFENVTIFDHPLIQHKISFLRDKNTGSKDFRQLVDEIAMLMAYEVTRDLPLKEVEVETPIAKAMARQLAGPKITLVPVLRAGLGMVHGIESLIPTVRIGHIGLYRDHETLEPVEYYCKLPEEVKEGLTIVLDPMLATGGSASAAIRFLKEKGAKHIKLMNIIGAKTGVERILKDHPDVPIYCGTVDEVLNSNGYINPGLGDAGDRLFGTL